MSRLDTQDRELGQMLHSAINPEVPEDLARRIVAGAITAQTGQDTAGGQAALEQLPCRKTRKFRALPVAACAALVLAAVSGTQLGNGGSEQTLRGGTVATVASNASPAAANPLEASEVNDVPAAIIVALAANPAQTDSANQRQVVGVEQSRQASLNEPAEAKTVVDHESLDKPTEASETYHLMPALAVNAASTAPHGLGATDEQSEIYGPIDDGSNQLLNAGIHSIRSTGYGVSGGLPVPD
ncbi:MAG: hypothetical protein AAGJ50_10945 [Pseudomonadota bacterium]